jgi:hypothetical protein
MNALARTESQFQGAVLGYAKLMGWLGYHTHDSRNSAKGFPDLVLVRRGRLVFAELKALTGRVKPEQQEWLEALGHVAGENTVVEVHLWRPSDWDEIVTVLR